MKTVILGVLVLMATWAGAQEVLLDEVVTQDSIPSENGPNRKKYIHAYYGFGSALPTNDAGYLAIQPGFNRMDIGSRMKYKVNDFFAFGFDNSTGFTNYRFEADSLSLNIDSVTHDKSRLQAFDVAYGVWTRFQFTHRGNKIGFYVDLGGYGQANLISRYVTMDKNLAGTQARKIKSTLKGLDYSELWQYGLMGRMGYEYVAIRFNYRLSDWLAPSHAMVTPYMLTLELGFKSE